MIGPGTTVRWLNRHGLVRIGIRAAARRGDEQAAYLLDPARRADHYAYYRSVRDRGAMVTGGFALSTARHDVATAVLRSDAFGVGLHSRPVPAPVSVLRRIGQWRRPIGPVDPPSMLVVDPPEHTRYRRLVSKVFTPRAIEALRPRVAEVCDDLLDRMAGSADVDLVAGYAGLVPVTVIAEILGVPVAMREQFLRWGAAAAPTLDIGLPLRRYAATEVAIRRGNEWMRGHLRRLRASPGDDLLSRLVHVEDGQARLTDDELVATAGLLLAAGFETTVNLIGTGSALLMAHPDQRASLDDDPARWRNAVEEVLRYDSPVQNTGRICRTETEIAGRRIRPYQVMSVLIGGANRDPAVFDDPDRFDVTRANAREHLAFSGGVHYCLGAALARLEGEVALRALFTRYPDLAPAGEPRRRGTRILRGYESLPVRLTAAVA
ncbi:cytochrome P450 [Virgisporangium ochraceum]